MKFYFTQIFVAITELELEVILVNNSAYSLTIDPVIINLEISSFGFEMTPALSKIPTPLSLFIFISIWDLPLFFANKN